MKLNTFFKLAAAAAACVSSLAQAVPITYTFTGITQDSAKLGVTGTLTIDTSTYTGSTATPGYYEGRSTYTSEASISFSDGSTYAIAAGTVGVTSSTVSRIDSSNLFVLQSYQNSEGGSALGLQVFDSKTAATSGIFNTSIGDLSLDQTVNFKADGSDTWGLFARYDAATQSNVRYDFSIISVTMANSVTAVPEPETYALMGLGLLAIGYTQRRRVASR